MKSGTMRAWISGDVGRDALRLGEVGAVHPGPGEAVLRTAFAALNYSDLLMVDDAYQVRPPRPFVPGQEVAGTIVETGPGCALVVGERVAAKVLWGGFAERAIVRSDMAIRVPDGLGLDVAATLPVVYTTAAVALTESTTIRPGETVLVLAAAGGVGLAAVEIAKALGARVIGAAGGAEKGEIARLHGADEVVDYRTAGWADTVKRIGGVDVVVDPVGGDEADAAIRLLAPGGRYLIVGFASGRIPQIPAHRLLLKRASAIGVYWNHDTDGPMLTRTTERLTGWLGAGALRPRIGSVHPFASLPEALAGLAARRTTGKVLLRLDDAA